MLRSGLENARTVVPLRDHEGKAEGEQVRGYKPSYNQGLPGDVRQGEGAELCQLKKRANFLHLLFQANGVDSETPSYRMSFETEEIPRIVQSPARPKWVLAICVWYVLSTIFSLLSVIAVYSGKIPMTAAQETYFNSLGGLYIALSVVAMALTLAATILLFRLHRLAEHIFAVTIVFNSILILIEFGRNGGFSEALGTPGLIGMVGGLVTMTAVFLYCGHLRKKGVLR